MNFQEHGSAVLDPEVERAQSARVPARAAQPLRQPGPASSSKPEIEDDFDDEPGFFRRNMTLLIVGGIFLAAGGYIVPKLVSGKAAPAHKEEHFAMVALPPPPPPPQTPPPPPPPQQQKEEKMEKQTPLTEEDKHIDDKPAAKDEPPLPATGLVGAGGANFGLRSKGGGNGHGGTGSGGGGGSKYGSYAIAVQKKIADRLRENQKTKRAAVHTEVRIWADATGHVTQVKTTGDGDNIKDALQNLQLDSPPPAGMKMPIVLRITETRPKSGAIM